MILSFGQLLAILNNEADEVGCEARDAADEVLTMLTIEPKVLITLMMLGLRFWR